MYHKDIITCSIKTAILDIFLEQRAHHKYSEVGLRRAWQHLQNTCGLDSLEVTALHSAKWNPGFTFFFFCQRRMRWFCCFAVWGQNLETKNTTKHIKADTQLFYIYTAGYFLVRVKKKKSVCMWRNTLIVWIAYFCKNITRLYSCSANN